MIAVTLRSTAVRALVLAAVLVAIVCSAVAADVPDSELQALKQKYVGGVYITYATLQSLISAVCNPDKKAAMVSLVGSEVYNKVHSFLVDYQGKPIAKSIGILQFRFASTGNSAGYKMANSGDVFMSPTGWSSGQAIRIAYLCVAHLEHKNNLQQFVAEMHAGTAGIADAWDAIEAAKADPYLGNDVVASAQEAFRGLIDKKPAELSSLQQSDPQRYNAIISFRNRFDVARQRVGQLEANERADRISVADAWTELSSLSADPMLTPDALAPALDAFNGLVDRHAQEMNSMRTTNPRAHAGIQELRRDRMDAVRENARIIAPIQH